MKTATNRTTSVIGPRTGRTYPAIDTGERWNGAPVLAFTLPVLIDLITADDGTDSNGNGLALLDDQPIDLTDYDAEAIPSVTLDVDGHPVSAFVPYGRVWDEIEGEKTTA